MHPFDQNRLMQLLCPYAPTDTLIFPFDFSDYLSLIWRLEQSAISGVGLAYYRRCESSLALALHLTETDLGKLVKTTPPTDLSEAIPNLPYRKTERLRDASDRRSAIGQLWNLRCDVLRIGRYSQQWGVGWPGSGIIDQELRERMFALLFTALPSQLDHYARLLLVLDIVLQELLTGARRGNSFLLHTLIHQYHYPDPTSPESLALYRQK
jgi:hypothetical protein